MYENSLVLSQGIRERPSSTSVSKNVTIMCSLWIFKESHGIIFVIYLILITCGKPGKRTLFLTAYDIHAPIKTKRVRSVCAPWLTKNLKELMFKRDAL